MSPAKWRNWAVATITDREWLVCKFRTPDMGRRKMSGFQCRSFGAETSAQKKKWPKAALILEILKITAHDFGGL